MPRICQSCCRRTKDDETILWTDHGPGEEGVLPEQIISFLNYSWSGLRSVQVDPKTSMQAVPCHIQKVQQGQKIENAPNNSAFLLEGRLTGLTSDQEFLLFSASRGSSNYGYT